MKEQRFFIGRPRGTNKVEEDQMHAKILFVEVTKIRSVA
jgi:hypothetical protein